MGGGNFITQAAPTNFHGFWPRKVLTPGESVEDYMEVTAAQKASIEAADARWVAPGEGFVTQWKSLNGFYARTANERTMMDYDATTGYFVVRCIPAPEYDMALTESEAMRVYAGITTQGDFEYNPYSVGVRVVLPPLNYQTGSGPAFGRIGAIAMYSDVEVIYFANAFDSDSKSKVSINTTNAIVFRSLRGLRAVVGRLSVKSSVSFPGCAKLEYFRINLRANLDVGASPNVRLESLSYAVANAANESPIVITVHPDVYAKLTNEENAEWHTLVAQAAEKQITFASA